MRIAAIGPNRLTTKRLIKAFSKRYRCFKRDGCFLNRTTTLLRARTPLNTPTTTAKRPMPTRAHSLKHYARHGPQWAHPCDHRGRIHADIPTRTRVFHPNQALIPDTPCGTSDQSVRPARLLARQIKQARSSKNRAAEKVAAARNRHSARQPRRGFRLQLFEPGMPDFSIPIRQAQSSS